MNLQLGQGFMHTHRDDGETIRTVMETKLKILVKPKAMIPFTPPSSLKTEP